LPAHLLDAYKEDNIEEFTLFHNPTVSGVSDSYESFRDKIGITTSMTKSFSKLLHETQKKKKDVKWVTHSQGGLIFSQAVKFHNKKIGSLLNNHTVFFQASANNMLVTKRILKKAGVKLHNKGYNNSPVDGVPQFIGANALTDVFTTSPLTSIPRLALLPLSVVPGLAPFSGMGPGLSPHTPPYTGMGNYGKRVANTTTKATIHAGKTAINSTTKAVSATAKAATSATKAGFDVANNSAKAIVNLIRRMV